MNYEIKQKNRWGIITPTPSGKLQKALLDKLSYQKQGAEYIPNPMWRVTKLYYEKTGKFPFGLIKHVLEIIDQWCAYSGDTYTLNRSQRNFFFDKDLTKVLNELPEQLRTYQKHAIVSLLQNRGGILCLPTGAGKTFTTISYLNYLEKPALVIVHTKNLLKQWKELVPNFVDVITYQSIKDKKQLEKYDILVFDECHHVAAKSLYKVGMSAQDHIMVGLSATPNREDGEELKMFGVLGDIVYKVTLRELINDGYLCDAEYKVIELDQDDYFPRWCKYQDVYKEYIVDNQKRNFAIFEQASINQDDGKKILVLVTEIEHGEHLLKMLLAHNKDTIFIKGGDEPDYDHDIIIATSVLDEGVDIPDREVIIMAAGGKSSIKVTQRIGRVLRKNPGKKNALIIDFKDNVKYLHDHYLERVDKYKEFGFKEV